MELALCEMGASCAHWMLMSLCIRVSWELSHLTDALAPSLEFTFSCPWVGPGISTC